MVFCFRVHGRLKGITAPKWEFNSSKPKFHFTIENEDSKFSLTVDPDLAKTAIDNGLKSGVFDMRQAQRAVNNKSSED